MSLRKNPFGQCTVEFIRILKQDTRNNTVTGIANLNSIPLTEVKWEIDSSKKAEDYIGMSTTCSARIGSRSVFILTNIDISGFH